MQWVMQIDPTEIQIFVHTSNNDEDTIKYFQRLTVACLKCCEINDSISIE